MRAIHIGGLLAASVLSLSCSGLAVQGSYSSSRPASPPPTKKAHKQNQAQAHPAHLGIPPGQLPPPGKCRLWFPGRPPGHQPRATSCADARREAPPGSWVVYRPDRDRKRVHVTVYDQRQPRIVVAVRYYDAVSGAFLYEGS